MSRLPAQIIPPIFLKMNPKFKIRMIPKIVWGNSLTWVIARNSLLDAEKEILAISIYSKIHLFDRFWSSPITPTTTDQLQCLIWVWRQLVAFNANVSIYIYLYVWRWFSTVSQPRKLRGFLRSLILTISAVREFLSRNLENLKQWELEYACRGSPLTCKHCQTFQGNLGKVRIL